MATTGNECRWQGVSDRVYTYKIYPIGTDFKAVPGNYIFAKETSPGRWANLYTGETGDLSERFDGHHKLPCARGLGATHIHTHVSSPDAEVRRAEESDIVRRYSPPCNG